VGFKFFLLLRMGRFKFVVILNEFGPYTAPTPVAYEKLEDCTM
jgi:hypothetical protein